MKYLISIIIPVYNSERYLRRCINSILFQTISDFELLLINDGSTDLSLDICNEYAELDSRVKVFNKPNGGVSSARNYGMCHSQGEWITFCDSDDCVDKNWLSLFVENISQKSSLIVQFYKILGMENCSFSHDIIFYDDIYVGLYEMYKKNILGYVWNKLFNAQIINSNHIRFNEKFRFREDEDFVLKYLQYTNSFTIVYDGAYYYDMPDLSTKYLAVDNFYTSLSMFSSIRKLIKDVNDRIYLRYLVELTNAFFATFDKESIPKKECITRITLYTQNVECLFSICEVSFITKWLLRLPPFISYYTLKLKSSIHRSLERMKF